MTALWNWQTCLPVKSGDMSPQSKDMMCENSINDTNGVEEPSPGLPDFKRATPGGPSLHPITFARSAASQSEHLCLSNSEFDDREYFKLIVQRSNGHPWQHS